MVESADSNGVKSHIQQIGYSWNMDHRGYGIMGADHPNSIRHRIAGVSESRSVGVLQVIPYSSMSLSLKELR